MKEAPIIPLMKWNKDRFDKSQEIKQQTEKQRGCKHENTIFDGVIDKVECENCGKKWTSFEYLWYWIESDSRPRMKVYELENTIYYLSQQVEKLESDIKFLRSEKRKLKKL